MKKILRQHSIQVVTWTVLAVFHQAYSDSGEQGAEVDFLNVWYGQQRNIFKIVDKEGVAVEDIRTLKKMLVFRLEEQERGLICISGIG